MPTTVSGTLDQAVAEAAMQAKSDQLDAPVVILSPACASFDQYEDFEARGDAFITAAADWINADKAVAINAEGAR